MSHRDINQERIILQLASHHPKHYASLSPPYPHVGAVVPPSHDGALRAQALSLKTV